MPDLQPGESVLTQKEEFIQSYILKRLGIRCTAIRHNKRLFIVCSHYESCFEIVRKLDAIDYSVHKTKDNQRFTLEIKH